MEWEDNPPLIYHGQERMGIFLTLEKPQFPGNKRTDQESTNHLSLGFLLVPYERLVAYTALGYSLAEVVRASPNLFHTELILATEVQVGCQKLVIHVSLYAYTALSHCEATTLKHQLVGSFHVK